MIGTTTKIVSFTDILGFSKYIQDYDSGEFPDLLVNLKNAIDTATNFVKQKEGIGSQPFIDWRKCIEYRLFSDCLCTSAPLVYEGFNTFEQIKLTYKYLMGYQILLLKKGYFIRGGITIGSYYSDEHMIFSGGLVEAYNLEHNTALYPRVVLSQTLVNKCLEFKATHSDDLDYMLIKDSEDVVFFNHFNYSLIDANFADREIASFINKINIPGISDESFFERDTQEKMVELKECKTIVREKLELETSAKVREKLEWFKDLLDFELHESNNRGFRSFKNWCY